MLQGLGLGCLSSQCCFLWVEEYLSDNHLWLASNSRQTSLIGVILLDCCMQFPRAPSE